MLALLINVVIALLILLICWYIVKLIAAKLGAKDPIPTVIDVLFLLIALVWFLGILGVGGWNGRIVVL